MRVPRYIASPEALTTYTKAFYCHSPSRFLPNLLEYEYVITQL